jgi:hypothetical protein
MGPQVEWFVIESDNSVVPHQEYFAGSYRPSDTVMFNLQVWNNRWGMENVDNVSSSSMIKVFFDHLEDKQLLDFCSIKINDSAYIPLSIEGDAGYVMLGTTLSGSANDGSVNSMSNYANVVLKFGPITNSMRNGLKNMFVDLELNI